MNKYTLPNEPIYIMPISIPGLFIYHTLKREGIEVSGFCDNDIRKHNIIYDGIKIISPDQMRKTHGDIAVIICELRYESDIRKQLNSMDICNIISGCDIVAAADSFDAVKDILVDELTSLLPSIAEKIPQAESMLKSMRIPREIAYSDSLVIPQVVLSVTRHCSLKCRDCVSLMQYYVHPKHGTLDRIIKSVYLLMDKVDFIGCFSIVGGEPFVYKQLSEVINHVGTFENIANIAITTNGTIIPSDDILDAIKANEVTAYISDYGKTSTKISEVSNAFENRGIKYVIAKNTEWFDCCKIVDGSCRDDITVQNEYNKCIATCAMLLDDKFYKCSFLAHATDLKAIPYDEENFINLDNPELSKGDFERYFAREQAYPGCRYCSGYRGVFGKKVPVAEQIKKPLSYNVHS